MPSRDNTPRGGVTVSPPADREIRPAAEEAAAPPPQEPPPAPRPAPAGPPAERGTVASRRALKNWRVRSRLLLLITIPTLTAVVLGGTRIVSSVQSALTFQRVEQLARLSSSVTTLAGRLEDERDQTALYLAQQEASARTAPAQLGQVQRQYALTAPSLGQVRSQVDAIGSTFPAQVQQDASQISTVSSDCGRPRVIVVTGGFPPVAETVSTALSDHEVSWPGLPEPVPTMQGAQKEVGSLPATVGTPSVKFKVTFWAIPVTVTKLIIKVISIRRTGRRVKLFILGSDRSLACAGAVRAADHQTSSRATVFACR